MGDSKSISTYRQWTACKQNLVHSFDVPSWEHIETSKHDRQRTKKKNAKVFDFCLRKIRMKMECLFSIRRGQILIYTVTLSGRKKNHADCRHNDPNKHSKSTSFLSISAGWLVDGQTHPFPQRIIIMCMCLCIYIDSVLNMAASEAKRKMLDPFVLPLALDQFPFFRWVCVYSLFT